MKIKGIVILSVLAICGILGGFSKKNKKASTKKKEIVLTLSDGFSENVQRSIILFTKEQQKLSYSYSSFTALLKETFPSVDKVTIRLSKSNKVDVKVKPHTPLLIVNDTSFFTQSGKIVAISDYHKNYHLTLPSIVIKKKTKDALYVSSVCKRFVYHCPSQIMKDYTITWYSPTAISLQNKEDKKFTVLAHNETNLSESLFKHCKQVHKKRLEKNTGKNKPHWIDVRFKNQIIIRSEWEELG